MRKATKAKLAALAAAILLSGGLYGKQAEAMPLSLGVTSTDAKPVQQAAVVCGYAGCVQVWLPYGYYQPYGYYGYYQPYGYYGPYGYQPYGYYRPYGDHRPDGYYQPYGW